MSGQQENSDTLSTGAPFLSIILASNRPQQLSELFDNLETTSANPASFELLIKVDNEDKETCAVAEEGKGRRPFPITLLKTSRGAGYYALHQSYQNLLEQVDKRSYFVVLLNDEVRFMTFGWDDILRGYIGHFPDHIFRLRISENRERRYGSLDECCAYPENFAVTTRRWYDVAEGMGDLWGPDSWHQAIEFMLGRSLPGKGNEVLNRGVPISKIELKGTGASVGSTMPEVYDKVRRISIRWRDLNGWQGQENFYRLASKLAACIHTQSIGCSDFTISEDRSAKTVRSCTQEYGMENLVCEISYRVSFIQFCSEYYCQFFDSHRKDKSHFILMVMLGLPRGLRSVLEPIAGTIIFTGLSLRRFVAFGCDIVPRMDRDRKQVHLVNKKTDQINGVISYRLT